MKKSRYTDSQIMTILNQAEAGTPVPDLCREYGMSSTIFYDQRDLLPLPSQAEWWERPDRWLVFAVNETSAQLGISVMFFVSAQCERISHGTTNAFAGFTASWRLICISSLKNVSC